MMLFTKNKILRPGELKLITSAAAPAGYSVPINLEATNPIARIDIVVNCTVSTAPLQATSANGICADGIANILKRVRLEAFEPTGTRTIVDCSGVALIERGMCLEGGVDGSTGKALGTMLIEGASAAASLGAAVTTAAYQIRYPIFLVPPRLVDPLASCFLLPVHLMTDKPKLTLEFASSALGEIANPQPVASGSATAGLSVLNAYIDVQYAQMTDAMDNWIKSVGGYVRHNFTELEIPVTASTTGFEIKLSGPGKYLDLQLRGYKNNGTTGFQVRGFPYDSSNPTFYIDRAGERLREIDFALLAAQNSALRVEGTGATGSNAAVWPVGLPGMVRLDFLGGGATDANELGSVLNSDLDNNVELKVVGAVTVGTAVSTGGVYTKFRAAGFRMEGNVDRFKAAQSK